LDFVTSSVKQGLDLFEEIWGFRSKSLIAPCYTWHPDVEKLFHSNGITHIQTGRVQRIPNLSGIKIRRRFTGERNKIDQVYTSRNVMFEPSLNQNHDWLSSCLKEIKTAFAWNKPAIISSHRLNFMGTIREENRSKNLSLLKTLLISIVKEWPDVEFVSSDKLGVIIQNDEELCVV
jgi:hypothetical protein